MFVGFLNLLVIGFTLAGAVVIGWSPALAAAVRCSRARLRHQAFPLLRTFATTWREQLVPANLLQTPGNVLTLVLVGNAIGLGASDGPTGLVIASLVAAALVVLMQTVAVVMDAHYDIGPATVLRLAPSFVVRFPGAPLLLAATLTLVVLATIAVPGLLPVISVGVAIHLCTALCLSFFAANDRSVAAADPSPVPPTSPASHS